MIISRRAVPCRFISASGLSLLASLPLVVGSARADAPNVFAVRGARIVPVFGPEIARGTIVLRDGRIEAVGTEAQVTIPADASIIAGEGLVVYPAFVDAASSAGLPVAESSGVAGAPGGFAGEGRRRLGAAEQSKPAGYASPIGGVTPEVRAADLLRVGSGDWEARREAGIGAALIIPRTGFFAGTSALALLTADDAGSALLRPDVAAHVNLGAGRFGGYPASLMGAVALTRQTLLDAGWSARTAAAYAADSTGRARPRANRTSEALAPVMTGARRLVFQANSPVEIPIALRIAREFGLKPLIRGASEAGEVADSLKSAQADVLLGINFPPKLPNAANLTRENAPTLQVLRRRANAPKNAGILFAKGVRFALTSDGLTSVADYLPNVRRAVSAGLPAKAALEAMTLVPAQMLGVDRDLGSLQVGKIANVLVADGDLMLEKTRLRDVFIDGKLVSLPIVTTPRSTLVAGANPAASSAPATGAVSGAVAVASATSVPGEPPIGTAALAASAAPAILVVPPARPEDRERRPSRVPPLLVPAPAVPAPNLPASVPAAPNPTAPASNSAARLAIVAGSGPVFPPAETVARTVLLRGGTVWTSGPQGVLSDTDVLLRDGKIAAIGRNLSAAGAIIIDARGKHVTPGLIDCHSHTAILGGVNEGTNIVTAEVRIADVLNPEDIGIYRELAGGLTTANVLHGSANAIGGQNAVIKLRWGTDATGLVYAPAPQGIKFALGENPTRSIGRFPNTRMGMEQVYRERFIAALDYNRKWADFRSGKSHDEPRRDLQLEAISEILGGKRLVHSHGYRQDEFLMLMRLCQEFGVHIATFQHVLEGYKIADEMAQAGIGGSTFSDWWAFKVEAQDAIPYNGALMAARGVVVSFNSDDGDLARRLNLEAAKAVKYGGMAPVEAFKFVTINPAKQLGIDKTTGSLEIGKDADVVLWSGSPLSVYSQCEDTWVEGVRRFNRSFDLAQRAKVEAENKTLLAAEGVKPGAGIAAARAQNASAQPAPAMTERVLVGSQFLPSATQPASATKQQMPVAPQLALQRGTALKTPELVQAIVGGTVHTVSGATIPNGVVVMRGARIIAVGTRAATEIPRGAKVIPAQGMHVLPGYLDAHTTLGLNEIESLSVTQDFRENGDFNPNVRAEIAVNPDSTLIPVARANGILTAVTMPEGRLLAGNAALLRLQGWTWEDLTLRRGLGLTLNFPEIGPARSGGDDGKHREHDLGESDGNQFDRDDGTLALSGEAMALASAEQTADFQTPIAPTPTAPASVAPVLIAPAPVAPLASAPGTAPSPPLTTPQNPAPSDKSQPEGQQPATTEKRDEADNLAAETALEPLNRYFDEAERYRKSVRASGAGQAPLSDRDVKLAAMLPVLEGREPLFVMASSAAQIRTALSWAKRRGLKIVLYADGEGVMDAAPALVAAGVPVILGPTLSYPERADEAYDDNYTLPARLRAVGVLFALSSGGDASNVRRLPDQAAMAACFGLSREAALRAITLDAAQILGVADHLGSLEAGKDATLIVTSGDPLEITSQVRLAWIEGEPVDLSNKQLQLFERYRARPHKP